MLAAPPARQPAAVGDDPALLRVTGLSAGHRAGRGGHRDVIRDVSLTVPAGQCLAVVGRSGSGKTTLARCIAGLHRACAGRVTLAGHRLDPCLDRRDRHHLAAVQYVFQDARAGFNPYRPVLDQVARPAQRLRDAPPDEARRAALHLLDRVGLAESTVTRRPDRLSGGVLHRAALARALAGGPACSSATR